MDRIDFRSDTVTWPTEQMREAMANAKVGDDVYGEDPTVNELERLAAQKLGKEAGLFVASGTMANLVSILAQSQPGDQAIVGQNGHAVSFEAGSMSALGGVVPRPLPTDETGRMNLQEIRGAVHGDDPHLTRSRLILLENSYGARSGYPISPQYFADVAKIAKEYGLSVHLDGARLFNAAVALGVEPTAITQHVDSVGFCFSKGLCAPVGSVICGSAKFIQQARRVRKLVGGAMRQAGVLAAAGLVALDTMVNRLCEDHEHAKMLACGLAEIPGIHIEPELVKTNIVFFDLEDEVPYSVEEIIQELREQANIWIGGDSRRGIRAVTHYYVGADEVSQLLQALRTILN